MATSSNDRQILGTPSFGQRIKGTVESFEALAMARLELGKAQVKEAQVALLRNAALFGITVALFMAFVFCGVASLSGFLQYSANFTPWQAWGITGAIMLLPTGVLTLVLRKEAVTYCDGFEPNVYVDRRNIDAK